MNPATMSSSVNSSNVAVRAPFRANDTNMCRRISFLLPQDLPQLDDHAVRPDFFHASHIVHEYSCGGYRTKVNAAALSPAARANKS